MPTAPIGPPAESDEQPRRVKASAKFRAAVKAPEDLTPEATAALRGLTSQVKSAFAGSPAVQAAGRRIVAQIKPNVAGLVNTPQLQAMSKRLTTQIKPALDSPEFRRQMRGVGRQLRHAVAGQRRKVHAARTHSHGRSRERRPRACKTGGSRRGSATSSRGSPSEPPGESDLAPAVPAKGWR